MYLLNLSKIEAQWKDAYVEARISSLAKRMASMDRSFKDEGKQRNEAKQNGGQQLRTRDPVADEIKMSPEIPLMNESPPM